MSESQFPIGRRIKLPGQHANLLRQGSVLVDPADDGVDPWLMFLLTHEVKAGDGQVLSKRLQFVRVNHVRLAFAERTSGCSWLQP